MYAFTGTSSAAGVQPCDVFAPTEEEELQFCSLQAMSAVLCCGPSFDPQCLAEESCLYPWLDLLLASKDNKVTLC